jgi:fatty-acyl-CoA synthase
MVADPRTLEPVPRDGLAMGEVMLRGNTVMKGYLRNARATDAAFAGGWYRTGDLAVWHPDGYVEVKDRSKDIIISGGENISSLEVEECLYRHPAVMEAAVVARPDEKWGESPCAFVALKPGGSASVGEILAWCREHLAHFKVPRTVVFGELPKTSTGKIQKFVLRERAKGS